MTLCWDGANFPYRNCRLKRTCARYVQRKTDTQETQAIRNQNRQFTEMQPDPFLQEYLDRTTFRNKDGEICEFTSLQNTT